ncbi:DNA alkylation repair protein [Bdellovibrio bacteriovorus]|uniref:DNA alkylation repair protein n=2 Tax=Bdellovibrio bacteriovorus TaxID=959 RepID=A0A150WFJ1_BDEBC|nr:DNA alkylation repair protein [Bdellovibrio bacteriovorus]
MVLNAVQAQKRLRQFATEQNREAALWFFKTGPGGYSQHDQFIGVKVPKTRLVSREYKDLPLSEIQKLLKSKIHEDRLLGLIILVNRMKKASIQDRKTIADFYFKNLKYVNNWDLVDSSAEYILGPYLKEFLTPSQQLKFLKKLAVSKNLWERRVSILTTFHFIRQHEFENTLYIAEILLNDPHDLIHKAVGWMVREVANRDLAQANDFLRGRYDQMPRTMLRYAIEKFPETRRKAYLLGKI